MKVRQYEIWLADLNPKIGTEPGKVRPVVVIQTDLLNRVHPSTLICPVTTNLRPGAEILRVHLEKGSCGLNEPSNIMIDQVRAIDNRRLLEKKGKVNAASIEKLKRNLQIILDLA